MIEEADLCHDIVGAAIEVHKHLGPGLLESPYDDCLCYELALRKMPFKKQVPLPLIYKGLCLDCAYRMDIVVADRVVLEIKSIEKVLPIHEAQLLTYVRLSGKEVGMILNVRVPVLIQGVTRKVLTDIGRARFMPSSS